MQKILISLATILFTSCQTYANLPLPTVNHVDVGEYVGKWYNITSLPQVFTRNCAGQTAEYGIINDHTISVHNVCIWKDGYTSDIHGEAVISNPETNAELIVTFDNFWTKLFRVKGDYNILKLDSNYTTVLIGSKDRKSLWILARTPHISNEAKAEYINYAKSLGFNVDRLVDSVFH
jgi:apolipoprotein D and lipocalin family protein